MARNAGDPVKNLSQLIALWDERNGQPWTVSRSRHGTNVAMVNAYASHSVNLARGVLAMHAAGLDFESVSLVRSTMECMVAASWHALFPEKTPDFMQHSAGERGKVLQAIIDGGYADDRTALDQVEAMLSNVDNKEIDPEGKALWRRFNAIEGGKQLYLIYRVLCTWDHATNSLTDAYAAMSHRSDLNPWGMELANDPRWGKGGLHWVSMEASLILRAQMAADLLLTRPTHTRAHKKWAWKLGVADHLSAAAT